MSLELTVVRPGLPLPAPMPGETVIAFDEIVSWIKSGKIAARFARYARSRMLVHRIESAGRPLPLGLALRWMTRGPVRIEDLSGRARTIDTGVLSRWLRAVAVEPFRKDALLRGISQTVDQLERDAPSGPPSLDLGRPPLYMRSDLSFGIRAGGSVGHIAGVVNALEHLSARPILITTDDIPTVDPRVEQHVVAPSEAFWNFRELPAFVLNDTLEAEAMRLLSGRAPSFVYQRYSLNNYTGIRLARRLGVPLVIEYNGSEIWMSRHWGRPLANEALSERIERLNLNAASLVVVVSDAMRDEILRRGVDRDRVLVNPNGVDPERYRPDADGSKVRTRFGLQDATVIGFIGTFGPWHGAETLARAYVRFRTENPTLAERVRLLLIGTGGAMPEVKRILSEGGAVDATAFAGLVPQEEGPACLAACDVLVSPHVPNPDGTPFFGSPTKLFEYMAMGRGIVASDLDQIGDVLEHNRTAVLVPPGDVDALASAVARLAADRALRDCLGSEARRVAVERHTWLAHTRRTLDCLQQLSRGRA